MSVHKPSVTGRCRPRAELLEVGSGSDDLNASLWPCTSYRTLPGSLSRPSSGGWGGPGWGGLSPCYQRRKLRRKEATPTPPGKNETEGSAGSPGANSLAVSAPPGSLVNGGGGVGGRGVPGVETQQPGFKRLLRSI